MGPQLCQAKVVPREEGVSSLSFEAGNAPVFFFFYITLPYRCEVSPCYKPEKSSLPPQRSFGQSAEAGTDLCSLLCLPIMTFSGALP